MYDTHRAIYAAINSSKCIAYVFGKYFETHSIKINLLILLKGADQKTYILGGNVR